MNKKMLIPAIAVAVYGSNVTAATTYTGDDYLAIHVEAEAYDSKDDRWYYFDETTSPDVPPDGDSNNSSTASGKAYMEVLPDRRVYGDERDQVLDENGNQTPIGGIWFAAGAGPRLNYTVDFPEAGRYLVYVRALKNGTEDNSVHAGLNNSWPNVGPLQLSCRSARNRWEWRSAQRTEVNHCGDENIPVYVDVPSTGQHTVNFSAREDGYEQDSFFLVKDLSENTRICSPENMTDIVCKDGGFEVSDGFVDVGLSVSPTDTNIAVGSIVSINHVLSNADSWDTATNAKFSVNLPASIEYVSSSSSDCTLEESTLSCVGGTLLPGSEDEFSVNYRFNSVGAVSYTAETSVTEPDNRSGNNGSSIGFQVFADGPRVDAKLEFTADKHIVGTDDSVSLTATIKNIGYDDADAATISVTLPQGATLVSSSVECGVAPALSCDVGELKVDASKVVKLEVAFASEGSSSVNATVSASNDFDSTNNAASLEIYASRGVLFEEIDGLLVAEAESFSAHQLGTTHTGNGWYLVSNSMQPAASLYTDNGLQDTASSNSYVVALERGDTAAPFDGGTAATLSYRVFFNSVGTYYLQGRAFVQVDAGNSVQYAMNGNWDHGAGALSWCDSTDGWNWSNTTESGGNCRNSTAASFEVVTPGEHLLSISMHDAGVELDKLVISNDASLLVEGLGENSTVYLDKVVDLALTSSVSEISLQAGVESTLDVIVSNNNATAAASDVRLTLTGLEAVGQSAAGDLDCQLLEDGDTAYKLVCNIGAIGPGESQQVAIPLLVAAKGESSPMVTVSALQSDDRDDNNTHSFSVSASAADGQASGGGGGGAMALSLALIGLLLLPLRALLRRRSI